MKAIGVKELKAKLSEWLRIVKAGEIVLVTERNEVIAEIRSAKRHKLMEDSLDDQIDMLAGKGEVTLRSREKIHYKKLLSALPNLGVSSQSILDQLRGE